MWLRYLWSSIFFWFRSFYKWILRQTTKMCELQRVCYGELHGAKRSLHVEYSLENTRTYELKKICKILYGRARDQTLTQDIINYAVFAIVKLKKVNVKCHRQFPNALGKSLMQIMGYQQLLSKVEKIMKENYDDENSLHEEKLLALWGLLQPDNPLESRVGKQWQGIGFQGDDPKTDFRGMGLLGLENLLFFAKQHNNASRHVLGRSHHPVYGYSYAIVGINIGHLAYLLLKNGNAKTHFYNNFKICPDLESFHQFFCILFYEFDIMWRHEKPKDIMEFNRVRNKFEIDIMKRLEDPNVVLRCNFVVENV